MSQSDGEVKCDFCKTITVPEFRYMGKLPYSTKCPTCLAETGYTTRKLRKSVMQDLKLNSYSRFYVVANWWRKLRKDIKD